MFIGMSRNVLATTEKYQVVKVSPHGLFAQLAQFVQFANLIMVPSTWEHKKFLLPHIVVRCPLHQTCISCELCKTFVLCEPFAQCQLFTLCELCKPCKTNFRLGFRVPIIWEHKHVSHYQTCKSYELSEPFTLQTVKTLQTLQTL